MKITIPLVLLIFIMSACSIDENVNKVAIALDEEKTSNENTLAELCITPLFMDSSKCERFNKEQTEQSDLQREAVDTLNLLKCEDLIDGKDRVLCKINIVVQNGDYRKCSQLPEIYLKLYPRGGCIFEIAKNTTDPNLCLKITNDLIKDNCMRYFEGIKKSDTGWDLPIKVGDSSNVPTFLEGDKIEWWAADFTYLEGTVRLPYSNAGKVKIKLSNGEIVDINTGVYLYYDDVNCQGIEESPLSICRGISWIYKPSNCSAGGCLGDYVGYCPSNQKICVDLAYNYTGEYLYH